LPSQWSSRAIAWCWRSCAACCAQRPVRIRPAPAGAPTWIVSTWISASAKSANGDLPDTN